jgi:hypothetical protein
MDGEGMAVQFDRVTEWYAVQILNRFVQPGLILLRVTSTARRWPVTLLLAADAGDADALRRLRVALLKPGKSPAG